MLRVALIISLVIMVTSCKKKEDPRQLVYKTWTIEQTEMEGDEVGQKAARESNTIQFTENGVVKLISSTEEISGTFNVNETATSMTTVMGGKEDTYMISEISESTMTLTLGKEKMVLKVKE